MRNVLYFIVLYQLVLVISCGRKNDTFDNIKNYDEIKITPEKDKVIKLSSFASEIEYLKLETHDDCLITRIDKYIKHKNLFFLFDSEIRGLFVFDEMGRFKYKIANKGKGPGELVFMTTFCIDTYLDRIEIWDAGKTAIIVYDISGQYINEIKLEKLNIVNFEKTPSGEYFIYNEPEKTIYSNGKENHFAGSRF